MLDKSTDSLSKVKTTGAQAGGKANKRKGKKRWAMWGIAVQAVRQSNLTKAIQKSIMGEGSLSY